MAREIQTRLRVSQDSKTCFPHPLPTPAPSSLPLPLSTLNLF